MLLHVCTAGRNPGCESGPHEKRLLHALLDNYNVLERPVVNESDPLQLSFGLTLMQIIDVVSVPNKRSFKLIFQFRNQSRPFHSFHSFHISPIHLLLLYV